MYRTATFSGGTFCVIHRLAYRLKPSFTRSDLEGQEMVEASNSRAIL
jgi:hypothetical protein